MSKLEQFLRYAWRLGERQRQREAQRLKLQRRLQRRRREQRRLACGHYLDRYYTGDLKDYMAALLKHVLQCDEAKRILVERKRGQGGGAG